MTAVGNVGQTDFRGAGSNQPCTLFGLPDDPKPIFDPDAIFDKDAALPDPRSDMSLGALCAGNLVGDWSPAAPSKTGESRSGSTLTLNHQSSASSNAVCQISEILPLEPQLDGPLEVVSYAAFPATAQSLRCTRCWTLKQKVRRICFRLDGNLDESILV